MEDKEQVVAAPVEQEAVAPGSKEAIYVKIGDFVKAKTGKRIGKTGGREIFDLAVDEIFASAVQAGSFRFNGGFGSLHVRTFGSGSRRLPSGVVTTFGERKKLRYEEGVVVEALVANGGDLVQALAARGAVEAEPVKSSAPATGATKEPAPTVPADEAADLNLD